MDADALGFVGGFAVVAQAGGVGDMQRHAFDLQRFADAVARGAGQRRHDRQFGPGQCVEQAALADVGLARQHHAQAFAQQRALARAGQRGVQRRQQATELGARTRALQEVDLLFRKVQRCFDQQAQLHRAFGQLRHFVAESPA